MVLLLHSLIHERSLSMRLGQADVPGKMRVHLLVDFGEALREGRPPIGRSSSGISEESPRQSSRAGGRQRNRLRSGDPASSECAPGWVNSGQETTKPVGIGTRTR